MNELERIFLRDELNRLIDRLEEMKIEISSMQRRLEEKGDQLQLNKQKSALTPQRNLNTSKGIILDATKSYGRCVAGETIKWIKKK